MRTPRQVKGSSISTICRRANNGQVNNTVDGVTGETITYQYDSLKRLLTATSAIHGSTSWQENYTYDGFGNLTTMAPYPTLNMGVNWQTNQLTNGTGYDSYGNVTSLPAPSTTTMSYDVGNRMVNVNGAQLYAYDQGNQRVYYRNTSGVETIYLYGAGGQKLAAYQATVTSQAITLTFQSGNVYFAGKLVGAENNAVAVDGLGSVRWSAAGGGHTYYPYGVEYSTSSGDTEKYATYTRDSLTGFDYAMNRYYFSQWGRFMSPDPSWGSARPGLPQSWNRYWYANGDPVNNSDPSGLDGVCGPNGTWMGEGCSNYSSGPSSDINEAYNQYVSSLPWDTGDQAGMLPSPDPLPGWTSDAPNCGFGYGTVCIPYPVAGPPPPASPPAPELPTCSLEVESRPLDYWGFRNGSDLHGFLDFTSSTGSLIIEGLHTGNKLTAAGNGKPAQGTVDGAITGPFVCFALPILQLDVSNINAANITYGGLGPNSSSALRYMLQSTSFLTLYNGGPWYTIPMSMLATGYYVLLPGVETQAQVRGGGPVRHQ
jgi:RHS repeat-associated protein